MFKGDPHIRRYFGYVQVCWKVEHFWLLSCKKNWEVSTSAFDVQMTRWRLLLRPMSRDVSGKHLCAYLERLTSDAGPDVVRAHWKVRVWNCERRKRCCCYLFREKEQLFRRGDRRHGEVVEDMECLSRDFEPFEADDLIIECHLVVDDPEMSSKKWWPEADDEGLKSLSDDLRDMFREGHSSDMVLRVGGVDVPAVKAILYARNKTLAEIINRDVSVTVIELPAGGKRCPAHPACYTSPVINVNAVWQLIGYLHYGRMDEIVFDQPSISVAECARILDVDEVNAHYVPEVLTLTSGLDVEEHVVTWFVTEFKEGNDRPIASPMLIHNSSEEDRPAWRLVLYPRGKDGFSDYVAIYAEASGGEEQERSKMACLEFAKTDAEQNFSCYRMLQKPPGEKFEGLGVDDFLQHPLQWEDGTLRIVFRLRMSEGAIRPSKVHHHVTSVAAFPGGGLKQLEWLSEDLGEILEDELCCDFTILCSGADSFLVHRSVMAARAHSFSTLVGTSDELDLGSLNVTAAVVSALLFYIYCGRLHAADEDLAVELLMLADYLGVDALVRTCSRIVEEDRAKFVPKNLRGSDFFPS